MISWKNERVEPAAGYVLLVVLSLCIKMKRRAERGRPAGICVLFGGYSVPSRLQCGMLIECNPGRKQQQPTTRWIK